MWSILKNNHKTQMVTTDQALPGRQQAIEIHEPHSIFACSLSAYTLRENKESSVKRIIFGMGCFWGAERLFWQCEGVVCTSVGYAGGFTPNPSYQEVCTGLTGHTEVVQVDFDPTRVSLKHLLKLFWESHDPTQEMRQGNDIGTQYRSAIYWTNPSQVIEITASQSAFQAELAQVDQSDAHSQKIYTEINALDVYYFAELEHQQYLHKNPNGYCGLKGTGIQCVW